MRQAQERWRVSLETRAEPGTRAAANFTPERFGTFGRVLEGLGAVAPVVSWSIDRLETKMFVAESDPSRALSVAQDWLTTAVREAGLPDWQVVHAEAITDASFDEDLGRAHTPSLLGIAELAERLGVSKQRASELAKLGQLPRPLAHLRATPVWSGAAIQHFVDTWPRRKGRPPANSEQRGEPPTGTVTFLDHFSQKDTELLRQLLKDNGVSGVDSILASLPFVSHVFSLKPLEDHIVVKPIEEEETTASGLVIPDTAKERPQEGEVIAVGPGRYMEDGTTRMAMDVKVDDRVIYSKYGGTEVKIDGVEHLILSARDVLAVRG
jgi:chaperonin GroES